MATVEVDAGVCGFVSSVKVTPIDRKTVAIEFRTACPNLKPLEEELQQATGFKECFAKVGDSGIYETFRKYCKHPACPVPLAVIKGIEVASGLALPRDVDIKISKE